MAEKNSFTDKDMGYKSLMTKFEAEEGESAVFVGFLRSAPVHTGEGGPMTMAQLGALHEFGAKDGKHPPERSFMRSAFDGKKVELNKLVNKLIDKVIFADMTKKTALGIVGEKMVSWMKAKIRSKIPPALAQSTLAAKGPGKTTPLVDTGQLINSIDWEVHEGKKVSGSSKAGGKKK